MRVTTDLWIGALRRRAVAGGAYVTIAQKGALQAGAVYVCVRNAEGRYGLLAPAPQFAYRDNMVVDQRYFEWRATELAESDLNLIIDRERSFDPDIWVVEIEDADGRSFIEEIVTLND